MSPYHQGPPFPVSSSPILPLDAQPNCTKRSSPLSTLSLTHYPHQFATPSVILSDGLHSSGLAHDSARSVPSDWRGNATAVCLNNSNLGPQYMQSITSSTGITSRSPHPPSRPLTNTPTGWDSDPPINLMSYAPLTQGSEGSTFFYRSPTPSARQRTNQACEKCRDRKTKCSGGRPTCVRCQTRGLVCEYAIEHRVRGPAKSRKTNISSLDPSSPTRASFVHHPYAPPAHLGHPRWELQPISPKAQEMVTAARTGWTLSDHSDESSDSSGAASFELLERNPYLGLANGQGVSFVSQQSRQGLNAIDHHNSRFHTMHHSAVDIKDRLIAPILRPSPSMPQLKPLLFQNCGPYDTTGTSLGTFYPRYPILNEQYTAELLHGSIQSRCVSSSSSCASHGPSIVDDGKNALIANGITSNTTSTPKNWPSTTDDVRDPWRADNSIPSVTSATDMAGGIPKSSSQTFNVSEWITGTDYCSSPERTSDAVDTVTPES